MRVLLLLSVFIFTKPNPSQVYGCSPSQEEKYQFEIHNLRGKLKHAYKDLNDKQAHTQTIMSNFVAKERAVNNNKIRKLKKLLSQQTDNMSPQLLTKNCVNQQHMEAVKLYQHNNALECLPPSNEVSLLFSIKKNILKLEKVANALVKYCHYLNPLENEANYLNMCITDNIRHIYLQIPRIEREFRAQLTSILSSVKKCMVHESGNIDKNLNMIVFNFHKCRSMIIL